MLNCYLMGVICESDTSVSMTSISLSPAASVGILRAQLCLSSVFVLARPQFSPNTIVQWLPRLEMHRAILKWWVWMRDTAYVLTRTSLFAQCSSTCPTSLALSPEIFLLFCGTGQGRNTKHLLWSRRDNSILYYPGFSQRWADISLLFVFEQGCKCVLPGYPGSRMGGRQISDNTVVLFKTIF